MRVRHPSVLAIYLLAAMGWWGVRTALAPAAGAPNPAQQPAATAPGVIKAEANLVLVDVIATDKKGNYIEDLAVKEFHVFEDDKEQPITSFSRATEAKTSAPEQKRYLVLFFDNSTMASGDQMRARQAAGQFVEKSASVGCQMAVVDFGGAIRIAQNFTSDPERLKRAVAGIKFSAVQPNEPSPTLEVATLGAPSLSRAGSDFGTRSVLLAIREVAKILRSVPGRKTLILFSGGFQLTPERESEVRATIDALNKANVAVYPIDIRGLQNVEPLRFNAPGTGQPPFLPPGAALNDSAFPHQTALLASLTVFPEPSPQQRPPGGGGAAGGGTGSAGGAGGAGTTGGGRPGGTGGTSPSPGGTTSTGGGRSGGGTSPTGTTGTNPTTTGRGGGSVNPTANPVNSPYDCVGLGAYTNSNCFTRQILPTLESAATNQQVLYQLAAETGGFHIFNTNDFLTGLTKILKELDQYYILGYVPLSQEHDGSYHRIRVKVERKGVQIRSRNGYYDLKSPDLLAGKPEGKVLEERAASPQPGDIPVSLRAPYFYTSPGVARVNLTLEIPGTSVDFEKAKGKLHSQVNVLGIAYRGDGSVAARFSDAIKLDYEKKEWKELSRGAFPYRNTFNIAPGKYNLKVVLSAGGEKFGKYEVPLTIEPFDGKEFQLAGPALSNQVVPVSQLTAKMDAALLDERTPLVFQGQEIVPSSRNRFQKGETVAFYVEVYEPLLKTSNALRIGVLFDILNRKTNQPAYTSDTILVNDFAQQGNPLVPVALKVPMAQLKAGEYRLEVLARDSEGNASPMRTEDFAVD